MTVCPQTMAIEFSPDASLLGCACDDGSVRLWKVAFLHESTGTVTGQFGKSQVRPDPTAGMPGFVPVDPVTMVRVCFGHGVCAAVHGSGCVLGHGVCAAVHGSGCVLGMAVWLQPVSWGSG